MRVGYKQQDEFVHLANRLVRTPPTEFLVPGEVEKQRDRCCVQRIGAFALCCFYSFYSSVKWNNFQSTSQYLAKLSKWLCQLCMRSQAMPSGYVHEVTSNAIMVFLSNDFAQAPPTRHRFL